MKLFNNGLLLLVADPFKGRGDQGVPKSEKRDHIKLVKSPEGERGKLVHN